MNPWLRRLLPLGWTFVIFVPTVYVVVWLIEAHFQVRLTDGSFRMERPWAGLLLFGASLALIGSGWINERRAPRMKISRARELAKLGRVGIRPWLRPSMVGARTVTLILLGLALMGPQSIHARDTAETEGIDIMLTLDVSLSMQAADIQPNRFQATQDVVDDFIRRRPNDRMGAVVFGRDAYTLLPLTTDKESLRGMIADLELGMVDGRGTAIGNAIGTSLNRLRTSIAASRVIILLTDGDSNSGNVSPEQAAEIARALPHPLDQGENQERRGVKIYTILMGRSADSRVQQGTDLFGRPVWDQGNFPINPELLQSMAETTGGRYFQVSDRRGLERSFHEILDHLDRSEIEDTGRVYGELFPAFLWPALFWMLFELVAGTLFFRRWP